MADKKIIVVVGATGAQGGGLAHAILADKNSEFSVRAITRDVNSDKAKALAALGAEVVSADVDDLESITKAFEGAYGAYCVTFFWNHYSPETEIKSATNLAKAAKAANLKHVVWSTLEDTRNWVPLSDDRMPTLQGNYKVPHFDAKGEVDHVFTDLGVPTTFLYASFYWDNFIYFGAGPKKGPDGELALTLPIGKAKMAGVAAEDIGKVAYGIFKKGPSMIGRKIGVAGEILDGNEMASAMSKAIGQPVKFNNVPAAVYRSFGFPGAEDLGNMFQFYDEFEDVCNEMRDVPRARELAPEIQSFDTWLSKNAAKIPLE
ncbi:MAG: nucleoside-diphosphate sugar epimerase [Gemmatimonadetes bacterium]|nr:nucleoside-diphosphate sugar epimerase [Gemmatimonadota bacterium]